jgi:CRISPR-associated protein Cmr4
MSYHPYLIHALSPMHCGTGQAISGIDLPIAREKHTGIPLVPGSSFKGVLRARPLGYDTINAEKREAKRIHLTVFGPETENGADFAGSVQFGDAYLVCLPVRSVRGTFAWVTSPVMLRRLRRDVQEAGQNWNVPSVDNLAEGNALVTSKTLVAGTKVVFEDFDFAFAEDKAVGAFAETFSSKLFSSNDEKKFFKDRFCVVHDNVMRVLLRQCMEVTTRNRIDQDTKTVEEGALWTEEALPTESILLGMLVVEPIKGRETGEALIKHVKSLTSSALQIGGNATVGRGLCRVEVL